MVIFKLFARSCSIIRTNIIYHNNYTTFRRYIWNYVRLENEHLFNVGQFRAVRDIFIGPIKTKNSIELQKMMDEKDGVENRAVDKFNRISLTDAEEEFEDE